MASSDPELRWVGTLVLGVGGAFPAEATLPMNHDLMRNEIRRSLPKRERTYWYPAAVAAFFFHGLSQT